MRKRYVLLFLATFALALFTSACSQSTVPTSGGTTSNLTPLQVLQKSADAMKQLKTTHVALQSTTAVQTTLPASSTPTTTATPTNTTVTITGSGDQVLPDQSQMNITVNQNTKLAEIVTADKIYLQNQQGTWYVLDKGAVQGAIGNPFSGVNIDQNSLLAMIQHVKITDNGTQPLNGMNLRHITASLDKVAVSQLLNDNPQLKGSLGQQTIDAILNDTQAFQSSVDVWIDETQFYVHRTELKLNLAADTSSLGGTPTVAGTVPSSIHTNLDTIVDLSKFDQPVTITPPANATPTNNPAGIFAPGA